MKHRARVLNAAILVLVFAAAAAAQSTKIEQLRSDAEQGDINAQFNLGVMYHDGDGVLQDYQEAVWIQDARTRKDRRTRMRALFRDYRQAVDAIIMLRAFRKEGAPNRYQLLEIPTAVFASIQEAPLEAFQRDAPLVKCRVGGETVAVVAVDRFDAKITVRSILLSACIVHAEWIRA